MYLGDYAEDYATLNFNFNTHKLDGTPTALVSGVASVYKGSATGTETTSGVTLTANFDGYSGLNHVLIDLSSNAFYAIANDYGVVLTAGTVDSQSVIGTNVATFSIINRSTGNVLDAVAGIGTAGGAAINTDAATDNYSAGITGVTSGTTKVGTQTGTYVNASNVNAVYHVMTNNPYPSIVYQFLCGGGTSPVGMVWTGYIGSATSRSATISAWNHGTTLGGPGWEDLTTVIGQNNTTNVVKNVTLYARHMGTSAAELGKVYIKITGTTNNATTINTDQLYVTYAVTSRTAGYADGAIWIDTLNGTDAAELYVNGTADKPVKTYAYAETLETALNIRRFHVVAGSTIIPAVADIEDHAFLGHNWTLDCTGAAANVDITRAYIEGAYVHGTTVGEAAFFEDCTIGALTADSCVMQRCSFIDSFTTTATHSYTMDNCVDGLPAGSLLPTVVYASGVDIGFRNYRGGLQLNNMAASNSAKIDGAGRVVIDASCTGGDLVIRGNYTITGKDAFIAAGGIVTESARYDTSQPVGSVTGNVSGAVIGAVGSVAGNVGGNVVGSVGSVAPSGIVAASFAADSIAGTAIDTTTVTKLQANLATSAQTTQISGAIQDIKGPTWVDETLVTIQSQTETAIGDTSTILGYVGAMPTTLEFNARTIPSADYVVVTDTIAGVSGNVTGSVGSIATSGIVATSFAANAITAAAIAADAITDTKVASDVTIASVTGAVGSVAGNVVGSVGSVTGAVGSIATSGIVAASFATNAIVGTAIDTTTVTKLQANLATSAQTTQILAAINSVKVAPDAQSTGGDFIGSIIAGGFANCDADDDVYFQVRNATLSPIDFYLQYTLDPGYAPMMLLVNGRYVSTTTLYINIYAWDWELGAWDLRTNSGNRMINRTTDLTYSIPLLTKHVSEDVATLGQVRIRFLSSSSPAALYNLYLDAAFVYCSAYGTVLTPQMLAEAIASIPQPEDIDESSTAGRVIAIDNRLNDTRAGYIDNLSAGAAAQEATASGIKVATDQLDFTSGLINAQTKGIDTNAITALSIDTTALSEIALEIIKFDFDGVTGEADYSMLNAMRALRNRVALASGVLTVYKEDGSTPAWSGVITTDAAALPITGMEPD